MSTTTARPTQPLSPAAPVRPAPDRVTGIAALLTAVVFTTAFALLGITFDYPGVLDQSAAEILSAYRDAGTLTYVLWYSSRSRSSCADRCRSVGPTRAPFWT